MAHGGNDVPTGAEKGLDFMALGWGFNNDEFGHDGLYVRVWRVYEDGLIFWLGLLGLLGLMRLLGISEFPTYV
jgi:hypothetical protein